MGLPPLCTVGAAEFEPPASGRIALFSIAMEFDVFSPALSRALCKTDHAEENIWIAFIRQPALAGVALALSGAKFQTSGCSAC
jgi:hypothetical protein